MDDGRNHTPGGASDQELDAAVDNLLSRLT
ncbi:hypothetical protein QF026_007502 [Streptomyces aurantiacus]|nr:hypothetical protein [Streptomyces aurantiacus]